MLEKMMLLASSFFKIGHVLYVVMMTINDRLVLLIIVNFSRHIAVKMSDFMACALCLTSCWSACRTRHYVDFAAGRFGYLMLAEYTSSRDHYCGHLLHNMH
jgi:hypothetical protein